MLKLKKKTKKRKEQTKKYCDVVMRRIKSGNGAHLQCHASPNYVH